MNKVDSKVAGQEVSTNVDAETFDMVITVLSVYSIELLNRHLAGDMVAEALKATVNAIAEQGAEGIIHLIHEQVTDAKED